MIAKKPRNKYIQGAHSIVFLISNHYCYDEREEKYLNIS